MTGKTGEGGGDNNIIDVRTSWFQGEVADMTCIAELGIKAQVATLFACVSKNLNRYRGRYSRRSPVLSPGGFISVFSRFTYLKSNEHPYGVSCLLRYTLFLFYRAYNIIFLTSYFIIARRICFFYQEVSLAYDTLFLFSHHNSLAPAAVALGTKISRGREKQQQHF